MDKSAARVVLDDWRRLGCRQWDWTPFPARLRGFGRLIHFLELEPLRRASAVWLGAYIKKPDRKGSVSHAHRAHERARR